MSVIGKLFGMGEKPKVASAPPPPPPKLGDAAGQSAVLATRQRMRKRKGVGESILASGLGDVGGTSVPQQRTTSTLG